MASSGTSEGNIVILGAGIIGVSSAFYLSEIYPGSSIHLVDAAPTLFESASGHAGGFISRDWVTPPLVSLSKLSFDLHAKLAAEHGGAEKWGYSQMTAVSHSDDDGSEGGENKQRPEDWLMAGVSRAEAATEEAKIGRGPKWFTRAEGKDARIIADEKTAAQIDPYLLCKHLLDTCVSRGVKVHLSTTALSISRPTSNSSKEITLRTPKSIFNLPLRTLLLSSGIWTPKLFRALFHRSNTSIPISSLAGHSLMLTSPHWPESSPSPSAASTTQQPPGTHAIFAHSEPTAQNPYHPEAFNRALAPHHIWLGGLNSSTLPIPSPAHPSNPIPGDVATLTETAKWLFGEDVKVAKANLCYRPVTPKGLPMIAEVPKEDVEGIDGVYIASGHGPWGISQSLGTGKVVSELIGGKKGAELSADISQLGMQYAGPKANL